jgi:flagellar protein FlgJ
MEITGFSAYLQDYRMSTPANALTGDSYNTPDFASIMERAKETGTNNNNAGKIDKTDNLYQLCLELETFLVKNLLTSMRNTVQKSGLIEQGFAGKMYEDMLYDEYAKDFTKNANFGLAEQAYLQLKRQQG